jgi:hypothetical protein
MAQKGKPAGKDSRPEIQVEGGCSQVEQLVLQPTSAHTYVHIYGHNSYIHSGIRPQPQLQPAAQNHLPCAVSYQIRVRVPVLISDS